MVVIVVVIESNFAKFRTISEHKKNPLNPYKSRYLADFLGGDKGTRTPDLLNAIHQTNRINKGFARCLVVTGWSQNSCFFCYVLVKF